MAVKLRGQPLLELLCKRLCIQSVFKDNLGTYINLFVDIAPFYCGTFYEITMSLRLKPDCSSIQTSINLTDVFRLDQGCSTECMCFMNQLCLKERIMRLKRAVEWELSMLQASSCHGRVVWKLPHVRWCMYCFLHIDILCWPAIKFHWGSPLFSHFSPLSLLAYSSVHLILSFFLWETRRFVTDCFWLPNDG